MAKFYAIRFSKAKGKIVSSWKECSKLVTGVSGVIYKKFTNHKKAQAFIDADDPKWIKRFKKKPKHKSGDAMNHLVPGCYGSKGGG